MIRRTFHSTRKEPWHCIFVEPKVFIQHSESNWDACVFQCKYMSISFCGLSIQVTQGGSNPGIGVVNFDKLAHETHVVFE